MKNLILCFLVLIQSVIAQMAPQSLPEFEHLEGQNYLISWESVPGRVYFIQTSSSLRANQFNWEYAPDIRMGTGFPIDMGFKANASNFEFFRLVYTDYSGGLDPNLADFDGDGYTNLEEAIANSDPFDAQFFPGNNGQGVGGANAPPSEYGTTWNHPWEYTLTLEVNDHASPPDVINPDNPVSSYAYSRELGHDTKITFKDVIGKNSVTFLDLEPNPNYDPNDASSKKYNLEVVELSAQNPEWSHTGQLSTPPGGNLLPVEIVPDDDQPGKTGDVIPSNKGATGEKHYVSPKKSAEIADDFVVLKAKGIDQALFEKVLEWEGGEAVPNEPLKRRVKRDATGKTSVKLKTKNGGQEVGLMNVWIVWSDVVVQKGNGVYEVGDGWSQYKIPLTEQDGWLFKFEINPKAIITDADRPALSGEKKKPVPGKGKAHLLIAGMDGDSAQFKWDSSRQVKVTIRNPNLISKELLDLHDSDALWVNQPKALDVVEDYPAKAHEGNDDPLIADEHSIPYVASNAVALKHQIGEIACHDAPNSVLLDNWGQNNFTFEVDLEFREFARLELWDGKRDAGQYWFKISDYSEWNFKAKSKFKAPPGDWVDNRSSTGN